MTKLIPGLKDKTYHERMKILNLPSLKHRRRRGDLIETFKVLNPLIAHDETVSSYKKTVPVSMKMYSFF